MGLPGLGGGQCKKTRASCELQLLTLRKAKKALVPSSPIFSTKARGNDFMVGLN